MRKWMIVSILMASALATAQDQKDPSTQPTVVPAVQPKMTTRDAKKACKDEGKTGADLIQCMKDKKQEK